MFNKIKCSRCNNKASKSFDYCPFCACPLTKKAKEEDLGMFGRSDVDKEDAFFDE